MSDDQNPNDDGDQNPNPNGDAGGDDGQDGEKDNLAELRSSLKAALKEVRDLKRDLKGQKRGGEGNGDKPDELATIRQEVETLRSERKRERIERQVIAAAGKAGAKADKALRIVRLYADDLDVDEDGRVANLDDVIAQAREDEPGWFGRSTGSADGGAGRNGSGAKPDATTEMNTLIRRAAGRT